MNTLDRESAKAIEALYALGYGLHAQERFADAAAVFRIMLQVAPTDERSWLALGECHELLGHSEVALELYGAGSTVVDGAIRCELARYRLFAALGRDTEAEEALEAATEIAENSSDGALVELIDAEKAVRS